MLTGKAFLGFGFQHAADAFAGALGHQLPLTGIVIHGGLACARMGASQVAAIVLACCRNAVALFFSGRCIWHGIEDLSVATVNAED